MDQIVNVELLNIQLHSGSYFISTWPTGPIHFHSNVGLEPLSFQLISAEINPT